MSFSFEIVVVFLENDLLALMLNCLCHSTWATAATERGPPVACDSWRGVSLVYDRFTVLWHVPFISVSRFEIGFCPLLLVQHKSCGMNDCSIQTRLGISGGNSPYPIQLF